MWNGEEEKIFKDNHCREGNVPKCRQVAETTSFSKTISNDIT